MSEYKQQKVFIHRLVSREEKLKAGCVSQPAIDLVDHLLLEAIMQGASDVHIQPEDDAASIRYRIDGVLYDQDTLLLDQASAVVSRLKVLAHLDIAQHRIPQDGKLMVMLVSENNQESIIDLRISTLPTTRGEKLVVRILDGRGGILSLDDLGFTDTMQLKLEELTKKKQGFILVTGPTGSGKTTTLYALIAPLNDGEKNIVTIEDPVEYELTGIAQSQVNEKAGFSFENGLRSILRQDPDIILVGEMRDKQTVDIAVQAALTGHLVLSTLHTNDAPSAITRLFEMGIEPFLVSGTLSGVLAQRLVRKLCDACKKQEPATQEIIDSCASYGLAIQSVFVPQGCRACHNRGYKGRIGLFELLIIDDVMRSIISGNVDTSAIKKQASKLGFTDLSFDACLKVSQGITSFSEVKSILFIDN